MVKDQRDRLNKLEYSVMTVSGENRDRTAEWSFVTVWRRMGEDGRCHDGSDQGYVPAF